MKYVMFEKPDTSKLPILFPAHVDHAFIAQCVASAFPGIKPVSAGFCDNEGRTFGKSVSLKLNVSVEDSYYISKMLDVTQ